MTTTTITLGGSIAVVDGFLRSNPTNLFGTVGDVRVEWDADGFCDANIWHSISRHKASMPTRWGRLTPEQQNRVYLWAQGGQHSRAWASFQNSEISNHAAKVENICGMVGILAGVLFTLYLAYLVTNP